jgi:hypothetical protein
VGNYRGFSTYRQKLNRWRFGKRIFLEERALTRLDWQPRYIVKIKCQYCNKQTITKLHATEFYDFQCRSCWHYPLRGHTRHSVSTLAKR